MSQLARRDDVVAGVLTKAYVMRKSLAVCVLVVGLTGCSTSGDDLATQSTAAMNELADGFDQGDMSKIRSAVVQVKGLREKAKHLNLPVAEEKRLQEKHKEAMTTAQTRLVASMNTAKESGKFSADQIKEISEILSGMN